VLAAKFKGEGKFELEEVSEPFIKNDSEVLLEVKAASICGTDVHILEVPPGHPANPDTILGHEYTGEVKEVGKNVKSLKVGDRVVIDPNITCGYCEYCKRGMVNSCINMTTLGIFIDGGFARYNVAPEKALYKISSSVPAEIAALAEPLSCVLNGVNKIRFNLGENLLILGAGPIGLYYTLFYRASGAGKIIVAELNPYRREFAKKCGASLVVDPAKENLFEIVMDETKIGVDIVIDAVGNQLGSALKFVKKGGTILLFGMNESALPSVKQYDITRNEINIVGTYIAKWTFPQAVKILESGSLKNLENLITHKISLKEIKKGIEIMKKGEGIKIIVTP
jgi:threonine dehydrogenase-like Zn-dependent dehydrogenase